MRSVALGIIAVALLTALPLQSSLADDGFASAAPEALLRGVPELRGMPLQEAYAAIKKLGLVGDVHLGVAPHSAAEALGVYRQHPAPGTRLRLGSTVTVFVFAPDDRALPAYDRELTVVRASTLFGPQSQRVSPLSGSLKVAATDLEVPAGPLTLQLRRTLRSTPGTPGLLGACWRLNWEKQLFIGYRTARIEEDAASTQFDFNAETGRYEAGEGQWLEFTGERAVRHFAGGSTEVYDAVGRLIESEDRNANRVSLSYQADGRLSRIDGPLRSFLELTIDSGGRLIQARSSSGASVSYSYGASGGFGSASPRDSVWVAYAYDERGRLLRIGDPRTGSSEFSYDDRERVTARTYADGARETYAYDDGSRTWRHTDPSGRVTTVVWDAGYRIAEITSPSGSVSRLGYDDEGRLLTVVGPEGDSAQLEYDSSGRMVRSSDSVLGETHVEYDPQNNKLAALTDPLGRRMTMSYDDRGNLKSIDRLAGSEPASTIDYLPNGQIRSIADADGQAVELDYDRQGLLSQVTDESGRQVRFEHDRQGRPLRQIDPRGNSTSISYDLLGRVSGLTDAAGATTRFQYADSGLLVGQTDPLGRVTRYQHDVRGRVTAVIRPGERLTRYTYTPDGLLSSVTDSLGRTWQYEYGLDGNLQRTVDPAGGATTFQYDVMNRLVSETGPAGDQVRYEYSKQGLMTRRVDPGERVREYHYDSLQRLVEEVDAAGRAKRYSYTDSDQIASVVPSAGPAWNYEYDSRNRLTRVSRGDAEVLRYEYQDFERLPQLAVYRGQREVSFEYDKAQRLTRWSDNLGGGASLRYDSTGRISAVTDSNEATTRFRYDLAGNLLGVTDPNGDATRSTYDDAGQLGRYSLPNGDSAEYAYDSAGRLTRVRDPAGAETTFQYDSLGNVAEISTAGGGTTRATYDAAGRVIRTTDARSRTSEFTYNPAGQLIEKRYDDGTAVTYRYDANGWLLEADDGKFPVRYQYDALGRRTAIEYPALERRVEYEYDEAGRVAAIDYGENVRVEYQYDALDRVTAVGLPDGRSIQLENDAKGRLEKVSYPNGVGSDWEYDSEDRVVSIAHRDPDDAVLSAWTHDFDDAGRVTQISDPAAESIRYRYDPAGQLIEKRTEGGDAVRYSYLPGGDRRSRDDGKQAVQYRYGDAHRLVSSGEDEFQYDDNGNLTERRGKRGVTRYDYDASGNLTRVTLAGGGVVQYTYAPTGERVRREAADGVTHYLTDGTEVLAELNDELQTTAIFIHGPGIDRPLAMIRGDEVYYLHADRLGSIRQVSDDDGRLVASYDYDEFGVPSEREGTFDVPFRYTGRQYDAATGLYYYRARYYDPQLGRFLSPDPLLGTLTDVLSWNPYLYVSNAPLQYRDPLGAAGEPTPGGELTRINNVLTESGRGPFQRYDPYLANPGESTTSVRGLTRSTIGPSGAATTADIVTTASHEHGGHTLIDQRPNRLDPYNSAERIRGRGGMLEYRNIEPNSPHMERGGWVRQNNARHPGAGLNAEEAGANAREARTAARSGWLGHALNSLTHSGREVAAAGMNAPWGKKLSAVATAAREARNGLFGNPAAQLSAGAASSVRATPFAHTGQGSKVPRINLLPAGPRVGTMVATPLMGANLVSSLAEGNSVPRAVAETAGGAAIGYVAVTIGKGLLVAAGAEAAVPFAIGGLVLWGIKETGERLGNAFGDPGAVQRAAAAQRPGESLVDVDQDSPPADGGGEGAESQEQSAGSDPDAEHNQALAEAEILNQQYPEPPPQPPPQQGIASQGNNRTARPQPAQRGRSRNDTTRRVLEGVGRGLIPLLNNRGRGGHSRGRGGWPF